MNKPRHMNKLRFWDLPDGDVMVEISPINDQFSTQIYSLRDNPDQLEKFRPEFEAWSEGRPDPVYEGTPLMELAGMDKSTLLRYRMKGIPTIEVLANMSEAGAKTLGQGGLAYWQAAQLYLKSKEQEALLEAATKPRRGRPPKEVIEDDEFASDLPSGS